MRTTKYLLIGGGHASLHAAMSIRERDPDGTILIVCAENHPPYDRPPLSKQMLTNDEFKTDDPYSKFDNYYPDNRIDLIVGKPVSALNLGAKVATLSDGTQVGYEKCLLATGSRVRKMEVPGADLPGVHYLRTIDDSEAVRGALQSAKRVVVIGGSYMGMEAASGCHQRGLDVTVVHRGNHPWNRFASPELGAFVQRSFEAKGVSLLCGSPVESVSQSGAGLAVRTTGGAVAEGDVVIACVGHSQNVELAAEAGLEVMPGKGVVADASLRTSDPSVWVAGDIAYYPDSTVGRAWHADHFLHARTTGKRAGANMTGENAPYEQVPYFYSDFLDYGMILRGDPRAAEAGSQIVFGDMDKGHFVELYFDDGGVLRMGIGLTGDFDKLDPWSDKLSEIIPQRPVVADLKASDFGL